MRYHGKALELTIEYGRYTLRIEPKGSEALTDIGKYLVVHERQADGSTKIVDDIFNSNTPGGQFNSVNKFAHGHADNFAVGLLCEMAGYGVPVVVVPHCKPQLASHPAFGASLETLRGMEVRVLFDPDAPYESRLPSWAEVTAALPAAATQGVTR